MQILDIKSLTMIRAFLLQVSDTFEFGHLEEGTDGYVDIGLVFGIQVLNLLQFLSVSFSIWPYSSSLTKYY